MLSRLCKSDLMPAIIRPQGVLELVGSPKNHLRFELPDTFQVGCAAGLGHALQEQPPLMVGPRKIVTV